MAHAPPSYKRRSHYSPVTEEQYLKAQEAYLRWKQRDGRFSGTGSHVELISLEPGMEVEQRTKLYYDRKTNRYVLDTKSEYDKEDPAYHHHQFAVANKNALIATRRNGGTLVHASNVLNLAGDSLDDFDGISRVIMTGVMFTSITFFTQKYSGCVTEQHVKKIGNICSRAFSSAKNLYHTLPDEMIQEFGQLLRSSKDNAASQTSVRKERAPFKEANDKDDSEWSDAVDGQETINKVGEIVGKGIDASGFGVSKFLQSTRYHAEHVHSNVVKITGSHGQETYSRIKLDGTRANRFESRSMAALRGHVKDSTGYAVYSIVHNAEDTVSDVFTRSIDVIAPDISHGVRALMISLVKNSGIGKEKIGDGSLLTVNTLSRCVMVAMYLGFANVSSFSDKKLDSLINSSSEEEESDDDSSLTPLASSRPQTEHRPSVPLWGPPTPKPSSGRGRARRGQFLPNIR